jgi:hypothetical protein
MLVTRMYLVRYAYTHISTAHTSKSDANHVITTYSLLVCCSSRAHVCIMCSHSNTHKHYLPFVKADTDVLTLFVHHQAQCTDRYYGYSSAVTAAG